MEIHLEDIFESGSPVRRSRFRHAPTTVPGADVSRGRILSSSNSATAGNTNRSPTLPLRNAPRLIETDRNTQSILNGASSEEERQSQRTDSHDDVRDRAGVRGTQEQDESDIDGDNVTEDRDGGERRIGAEMSGDAAEAGQATVDVALKWDWRSLWSAVMLSGTKALTRDQFESVRLLAERVAIQTLEICNPSPPPAMYATVKRAVGRLPHYSTIRKSRRKVLHSTLALRCEMVNVAVDMRASGAKSDVLDEFGSRAATLKVTLPSELARADMACPETFQAMKKSSLLHSSSAHGHCVDTIPVVQGKRWFYKDSNAISVDSTDIPGVMCFAEPGDDVEIGLLSRDRLSVEIENCFLYRMWGVEKRAAILGKMVCTWTVQNARLHESVDEPAFAMTDLSPLDRDVVKRYSFCSYLSPSDGKSARERADLWAKWVKPILKPGDVVAMFSPGHGAQGSLPQQGGLSEANSELRVFMVHRFWLEHGEQDRHVFVVSNAAPERPLSLFENSSPITDENKIADVGFATLVRTANDVRGPQAYPPVSSFGETRCGQRYLIYRFYLYWDAFIVHETTQASAEGLYLVPLNIAPDRRRSQHDVRVVTLTPPGVKADAVFDRVAEDIKKGGREGFEDYDAEGKPRRIFLDLLGFVGDTPAINDCLDVRGHSANSPCHQCHFQKHAVGVTTSHFAPCNATGAKTASRRTSKRHAAVRSCEIGKINHVLLGLNVAPTLRQRRIQILCDQLSGTSCMFSTRAGVPLVQTCMDPYAACWIAPDHVLTGHLEDCVNLCFVQIPSRPVRRIVEKMLLQMLRESGLTQQNKILNATCTALFKMGMSDLYAVGVLAPLAFKLGIEVARRQAVQEVLLPSNFSKCLRVLESVTRLIHQIFWEPTSFLDTTEELTGFYEMHSVNNINRIRAAVQAHLGLVREVCTPERHVSIELNDPSTSRSRKQELQCIMNECNISIREVDKPNLHRLLELVGTTLHMLSKLSLIGELILERRHQVLKRSAKRSNNHSIHLHGMDTVVFNDWQSRLNSNLEKAHDTDPLAQLACFRLLQGREAVHARNGSLSTADVAETMKTLTRESPLPAELKMQALTVLSAPANHYCMLNSFRPSNASIITPSSRSVFTLSHALRTAHPECLQPYVWRRQIQFSSRSSLKLPHVSRNSILRSLCVVPSRASTHFPIVQLSTRLSGGTDIRYWAALDIVSVRLSLSSWAHYARVVPVYEKTVQSNVMYVANTVSEPCLLPLTSEIQLAAHFHNCASGLCSLNEITSCIEHKPYPEPLHGAPFFILSRTHGFPPRSG